VPSAGPRVVRDSNGDGEIRSVPPFGGVILEQVVV
jgi:hypothetical protein